MSIEKLACDVFGHTWILGLDAGNIKDAVVVCSTCKIIDPEPEEPNYCRICGQVNCDTIHGEDDA